MNNSDWAWEGHLEMVTCNVLAVPCMVSPQPTKSTNTIADAVGRSNNYKVPRHYFIKKEGD